MSLSAQEKWCFALSARGGSTFGGLVSILQIKILGLNINLINGIIILTRRQI